MGQIMDIRTHTHALPSKVWRLCCGLVLCQSVASSSKYATYYATQTGLRSCFVLMKAKKQTPTPQKHFRILLQWINPHSDWEKLILTQVNTCICVVKRLFMVYGG